MMPIDDLYADALRATHRTARANQGPPAVCTPGTLDRPRNCSEHVNHLWCSTCDGYYPSSHAGWHDGPFAHPRSLSKARSCVCRPCRDKVVAHQRELESCAVLQPAG